MADQRLPALGHIYDLEDPQHDQHVITVLAADQSVLASRFAAAGRPSARLLMDDVPHERAAHSGALVVTRGLAALVRSTISHVITGDHRR